jgi:hypothetical protein
MFLKKKISLLFPLILGCNLLSAQPWMPQGPGPVKFSDVLKYAPAEEEKDEEKKEKLRGLKLEEEDEHYHFDRWKWYWQQHLDDNGYIVSPVRAFEEWKKASQASAGFKTTASTSNWIFQGPTTSASGYNGVGRVTSIEFDPVDSNTLYVGSPAGGTWKTTDGGNTWVCLYNNLLSLGVADIEVNPQNRNTIYIATGDGDAGDSYSSGVIKSTDGGVTWANTGLSWAPTANVSSRSLLLNPADTNKLLLATDNGLYKTNDAGATWNKIATYNFRQIVYKPGDTSIIYASANASSSAQIMRSTNGGYTWASVTTLVAAQRIALAVTPANPGIVKAIVSNNKSGLMGIYNSTNAGLTYTPIFTNDTSCVNNLLSWDNGLPSTSCGGQGWYDLCIAIDPLDENKVTIGGVNSYYSDNGGYNWVLATEWWGSSATAATVHADKHWLGYNPLNKGLYLGCDGGIYKTYDPVGAWADLTDGIGTTQFYRNAVVAGADYCLGGSQDNGTKLLSGGGMSDDVYGGDGMQCLINYGDPANTYYAATQNGHVNITRDFGANFKSITSSFPNGAWITPYVLHPWDTATLYIAYKNVNISFDNGGFWNSISPKFDTNTNIEFLALSDKDPNYIYTAQPNYSTWKTVIRYTTDLGGAWHTLTHPFTRFVSRIVVQHGNENQLWATLSGYGSGKVYRHDLTTGLWENFSAGLPDLPVNCMVIDTFSGTKYVGTDAAIYYMDTTMSSWALYNTNLPAVHVYDLNINYQTCELWAATYGRGMWKSIKRDLPNGIPTHTALADVVTISPNPAHGSFTVNTTGLSFRNAAVSVRLLTIDGKTVLNSGGTFDNSGKLRVNTDGLAPGFYICEVSNEKGTAKSRVVIY